MRRSLVRRQTPEEEELKRKKAELAALEAELAERELELATLLAELRFFERRYLFVVGARYVELDEIKAQIAQAEARLNPDDAQAQERAAQARAKAQESAQAAGTAPQEVDREQKFTPSESLRKLYREVAKRVHPDLATDEEERVRRTRLMAEANRAYEEGDQARLEEILRAWESSPEAIKGEDVGAELVRAIRKIAQVKTRLANIAAEIAQWKESSLHRLKAKVEEAEQQGRDLLAEMAASLDQQIVEARERLAAITLKKAAS